MSRKVFAVAALSLLALVACNPQANVMENGARSSAMMEDTSSSVAAMEEASSAMMEASSSSMNSDGDAMMEVEVEAEGNVQ